MSGDSAFTFVSTSTSTLTFHDRVPSLLDGDGLRLLHQPILDLCTGRVVAVETLARLLDPEFGLVSPHAFLRAVSRHGRDAQLLRLVLATSLHRAGAWRRLDPDLRVTVNVRAVELSSPCIVNVIETAAADAMVSPSALILEVMESHRVDPATTSETVKRLRALGVGIAIDDFGTGHSTVGQLEAVDADIIKIDGSFAAALADLEPAGGVVELAISLAKRRGLIVICEGVESEQQAAALRRLNCPWGQGYFLGRPTSEDAIAELLV